jgi:hypothetical protein
VWNLSQRAPDLALKGRAAVRTGSSFIAASSPAK